MKSIKFITSLFFSLFFIALFSTAIAVAMEVPVQYPATVLVVLTVLASYFASKGYFVKGVLSATIYREVWTGEVLKRMITNDDAPWAARIKDYSRHVSNVGDEMQVIHLAKMGVLPNVLVNNTTYPIPTYNVTYSDVPIALHKYQTEVSIITDDQVYASSVNQMGEVPNDHAIAINIKKYMMGIHALAPSGNTADMPVLLTTGPDDGTGRKRLVWEDVQRFKAALDNLENPTMNNSRILVLNTDHENDLTLIDQKFKDQFYNRADGKPYNQLNFDFYTYHGMPYYAPGTLLKKSFGSVPAGTDRKASVYFNLNRAAKAMGWVKTYLAAAGTLPRTQQNEFSARHNGIILPTAEEARGAIVSANV